GLIASSLPPCAGRLPPAVPRNAAQDQVWTAIPVGTSSTHVFPGESGISFPDRSLKTVRSETFGRLHVPSITWPFRHTYAFPLPVGITSGETTPFTSLTGPCLVFTIWMTTFFAETCSPFSSMCGTVPCDRSHVPPCHFQKTSE